MALTSCCIQWSIFYKAKHLQNNIYFVRLNIYKQHIFCSIYFNFMQWKVHIFIMQQIPNSDVRELNPNCKVICTSRSYIFDWSFKDITRHGGSKGTYAFDIFSGLCDVFYAIFKNSQK